MNKISTAAVRAVNSTEPGRSLTMNLYFRFRLSARNKAGDNQWNNLMVHAKNGHIEMRLTITPTELGKKRTMPAKEYKAKFKLSPTGFYMTDKDLGYEWLYWQNDSHIKDYLKAHGKVVNTATNEVIWEDSVDTFDHKPRTTDTEHYRDQFAEVAIKLSSANTLPIQGSSPNQIVVTIPQGAGWYVIKEAEPFDSLIKRIFLNPKDYNFEVMRAINTHLPPGPVMLQPGQVVIVALEKNNSKVKSMMTEAKQAQAEWQKYAMFSTVQKTLLANLADFGMSAAQYGGTLVPLKEKKPYDPSINLPDELSNFNNIAEAIIAFSGELKTQTLDAYNRLGDKWNKFKIGHTGSQAAISARWKEFKRQNASEFQKIRSAIGKNAMRIDHGMKVEAVGLRQALAKTPSVREPHFSAKSGTWNGIKEYTKALKGAGKIANGLRIGGVVMIGLKFADSASTINDARQGGKENFGHVATVESWKLAGDVAGGFGGGYAGLASGIALVSVIGATGGLALVVIGLAVAAGGFAGGHGGKKLFTAIGEGVDEKLDLGITDQIYELME